MVTHGKVRAIREEGNHTGFWDIEGNSIQIAVDLEAINFPNQYNVAFSAEDFSNFDLNGWRKSKRTNKGKFSIINSFSGNPYKNA